MERVFPALREALARGERAALCGVIESSGSTPRGPGARMAGFADGSFAGTIGGGSVERLGINSFFVNILGGAVAAALALAGLRLGLCRNMDKVVIGVLMNMVPGVAITNSMRDIMAGDLMAGQTKLTEALFAAVAMAAGSGMALSLAIWL